jgi:hypothetical protein
MAVFVCTEIDYDAPNSSKYLSALICNIYYMATCGFPICEKY